MNFKTITLAFGKAQLVAQKNSPAVLFVVGIGGVVGGAILASRATLKARDVLEKKVSMIEDIKGIKETSNEYSQQDEIRDLSIVYADIVVDLTKLYGPAIIVGGIGIACLTGSHRILTKRNAALTAAYATLERTYNAYRERVREALGEENEREIHYSVQKEMAEKDLSLPKKGLKEDYSVYAKFFDEANPNWTRSAEKNLMFLKFQQQCANDVLHSRGHILLNDVYDMLAIPRTKAGCVVGWTLYGEGDNYVDFGIFNHHTDEVRSFVNGVEKSILLDFNVDGVILDQIER